MGEGERRGGKQEVGKGKGKMKGRREGGVYLRSNLSLSPVKF